VDTYGYSNTDFLSRWSGAVMAEYPRLNLVGEEWSPLIPWSRTGSAASEFRRLCIAHAQHDGLPAGRRPAPRTGCARRQRAQPEQLYETVSQDYLYAESGNLVLFEGNHDLSRLYSALVRIRSCSAWRWPSWRRHAAHSAVLRRHRDPDASTVKGRDDASYRRDFPAAGRATR
jgi:hypothetical protein